MQFNFRISWIFLWRVRVGASRAAEIDPDEVKLKVEGFSYFIEKSEEGHGECVRPKRNCNPARRLHEFFLVCSARVRRRLDRGGEYGSGILVRALGTRVIVFNSLKYESSARTRQLSFRFSPLRPALAGRSSRNFRSSLSTCLLSALDRHLFMNFSCFVAAAARRGLRKTFN